MHFVEILTMAVALSVDASAVSLAASTSGYTQSPGRFSTRVRFRLVSILDACVGLVAGQRYRATATVG